jgi:hypothetical protein
MGLGGVFKLLPRTLLGEGKLGVFVDGAAIGLDQDAVSVVEGGPEIMQRITEDGWCVLGKPSAYNGPRLTVVLGDEGFLVGGNVDFENAFQLTDVMIGPFGL